jgi:hypothetical protein
MNRQNNNQYIVCLRMDDMDDINILMDTMKDDIKRYEQGEEESFPRGKRLEAILEQLQKQRDSYALGSPRKSV